MFDNQLIEKKMFSLCLGKNGGYFQMGGYNGDNHTSVVQWVPLLQTDWY
jgi:hypothetical protein